MLTPYKLESDADGYTFLTDSKILYRVSLQDTTDSLFRDFLSIKSLDISFLPDKNQRSFDERIALTISDMVKKLLVEGYVVTFSCETADNRHKGRYKLFNNWFKKYSNEYFEKIDSDELNYEDNIYYISLLFDTRQYKYADLNQFFQKSINEYASYKLE